MYKSSTAAALLMALCASLCPPVWSADGAKGLFYEQLEKPAEQMNTGVQYWIELHRGDKTTHVNNKTPFYSGDRIRFHVKSNVDAYAYIVLREGSSGEQAVLFPDPSHNDETKVVHGKDYSLPAEGFLTFDDHPGTERLLLLVSRVPVDASAYLNNARNDRAQIVATVAEGSKDLIPATMVVAYETPTKDTFKPKPDPDTAVIAHDSGKPTDSKPPAVNTSHKEKSTGGNTSPAKPKASKVALHKPASTTNVASNQASATSSALSEAGMVTVVHRDPGAVLALDLTLDHER
jgi:hypothetical protein